MTWTEHEENAKSQIFLDLSIPAAELFLAQPGFAERFPENERELRAPVAVRAIDLFAALGQIILQVPQIGRLLDPGWPCALLPESPREAPASEQRRRHCGRWFFLTSTTSNRAGWHSRSEGRAGWAGHVQVLRGRILSLAGGHF